MPTEATVRKIMQPEKKLLVIVIKNYAKTDIKVFCCYPVLLDFFTLFQIFYPGLQLSNCFF